jgi:hypothetical protein
MQEFFREAQGRGNFAWQREKQLRKALKAVTDALQCQLNIIISSYASELIEGVPVRSSLSLEGESLAQPLEKVIAQARELLIPPKKKVDTREVEESTLPASGSTVQEEETYGTQS